MPDLFHLTVIKLNPFENKMEIKKENASGITIEVKSNGEIHPGTSEVTIVEEAYPKNTSKCVREIEAEKIALNVLLNDREAKRVISELIKSYGSLIVEFYKRQGISQQNGEIIERVCTGELMIYPKDFFRRDTIVYTHVDFVNKKLYLVPTLCDEISGSFCIRHVNLDFRAPTEKEEEFVREVLREKGYEWNKTSIAVIQQYIKLPNGTLVPSTVIYQVVLESESSETHRGFALTFDNKAEDIWIKGIFIIS
jgi:hypothetical protein